MIKLSWWVNIFFEIVLMFFYFDFFCMISLVCLICLYYFFLSNIWNKYRKYYKKYYIDLFDDDSFEDGENDVYIIVDEVVFVELWVRKIVLYYKCV